MGAAISKFSSSFLKQWAKTKTLLAGLRIVPANNMLGFISNHFVATKLSQAIELGKRICDKEFENELTDSFFKFVCLCSDVRKSIDMLSLRFDVDHMRFLYESEGIAEY